MTAEYIAPDEQHTHNHIEISPEDRETASKIGELLSKRVVGAMVRNLEQEIALTIAQNPNDPELSQKRYELEVWYQTNILAHD